MFLTCLVPSLDNPKSVIDVFLQPLIYVLKRLWIGEWTYDISRKQNFRMRAALMWTINDFPTYVMLSGGSTHGRFACPHCLEHTKAFTLKNGRKSSWFDSNHRFLPCSHPFRRSRNDFSKGGIVVDDLPLRLHQKKSGQEFVII